MKAGWKTSEAWLTGGAVPVIVTIAGMATPVHTKVASIIAVAAVSVAYTTARTWLKSSPSPKPSQVGQMLEQQFRCSAAGGQRTSTPPAQKRADLERVTAS
jgi:hypothetical protein